MKLSAIFEKRCLAETAAGFGGLWTTARSAALEFGCAAASSSREPRRPRACAVFQSRDKNKSDDDPTHI
jgi:hypothetical protein